MAGDSSAAPPWSVGSPGPTIVVGPITRTDIVRYAGAGGDFNPLHHDEEYAREQGLPTIFAMGLFQAGLLSRVATEWFGLSAIKSYSVRFRAQVWPGESLRMTGEVTGVEEAGETTEVTATLRATNESGEVKLDGQVVAAFATQPVGKGE